MDGSFRANRQGIPFASLAFVMLKSSPVMGFYDTPFCTVWPDVGGLDRGTA